MRYTVILLLSSFNLNLILVNLVLDLSIFRNYQNLLSGALDENGLIDRMNLNAIQDREICCYSISCKEKDNIDITLQWLIAHSKSGGGAAQ